MDEVFKTYLGDPQCLMEQIQLYLIDSLGLYIALMVLSVALIAVVQISRQSRICPIHLRHQRNEKSSLPDGRATKKPGGVKSHSRREILAGIRS